MSSITYNTAQIISIRQENEYYPVGIEYLPYRKKTWFRESKSAGYYWRGDYNYRVNSNKYRHNTKTSYYGDIIITTIAKASVKLIFVDGSAKDYYFNNNQDAIDFKDKFIKDNFNKKYTYTEK